MKCLLFQNTYLRFMKNKLYLFIINHKIAISLLARDIKIIVFFIK